MKRVTVWLLIAVVGLVGFFGFYMGHTWYVPETIMNKPISEFQVAKASGAEVTVAPTEEPVADVSHIPDVQTITPSTKIVYHYYYSEDGRTETIEEEPPYFLVGETKEGLIQSFPEWDIESFTTAEVVMKKTIEGKSAEYYIVGDYEGYVAVFYEKEVNGESLKEITDMPMSALPEEEQQKLKNGIHVAGNDALNKILEDYGS